MPAPSTAADSQAAHGSGDEKNEGKGSRSGARQYSETTREFIADDKVEPVAREALRSVEGPEAADLKKAETEGKRHAHGEDPALRQKAP